MKEHSVLLCHLGYLQNEKQDRRCFKSKFFVFIVVVFFIFNKENPEINTSKQGWSNSLKTVVKSQVRSSYH